MHILLLLLLLVTPAHAALVSFWNFEEGTGTNADDSVSNLDCTLTGNATWAVGLVGSASMSLDGNGDYCNISAATSALKPTLTFAISAWYRGTAADTGGNDLVNLSDRYAARIETTGNAKCYYQESAGVWREHVAEPTVNLLDGNTHHIVCQKTATALEIYVDNGAKGSTAFATNINYVGVETGDFSIGRNPSGSNQDTNGQLDQVRFYNAALTLAEIAQLYAEGMPRKGRPLVFP